MLTIFRARAGAVAGARWVPPPVPGPKWPGARIANGGIEFNGGGVCPTGAPVAISWMFELEADAGQATAAIGLAGDRRRSGARCVGPCRSFGRSTSAIKRHQGHTCRILPLERLLDPRHYGPACARPSHFEALHGGWALPGCLRLGIKFGRG